MIIIRLISDKYVKISKLWLNENEYLGRINKIINYLLKW